MATLAPVDAVTAVAAPGLSPAADAVSTATEPAASTAVDAAGGGEGAAIAVLAAVASHALVDVGAGVVGVVPGEHVGVAAAADTPAVVPAVVPVNVSLTTFMVGDTFVNRDALFAAVQTYSLQQRVWLRKKFGNNRWQHFRCSAPSCSFQLWAVCSGNMWKVVYVSQAHFCHDADVPAAHILPAKEAALLLLRENVVSIPSIIDEHLKNHYNLAMDIRQLQRICGYMDAALAEPVTSTLPVVPASDSAVVLPPLPANVPATALVVPAAEPVMPYLDPTVVQPSPPAIMPAGESALPVGEHAMPAGESALPATTESALPATTESALPATTESAMPAAASTPPAFAMTNVESTVPSAVDVHADNAAPPGFKPPAGRRSPTFRSPIGTRGLVQRKRKADEMCQPAKLSQSDRSRRQRQPSGLFKSPDFIIQLPCKSTPASTAS